MWREAGPCLSCMISKVPSSYRCALGLNGASTRLLLWPSWIRCPATCNRLYSESSFGLQRLTNSEALEVFMSWQWEKLEENILRTSRGNCHLHYRNWKCFVSLLCHLKVFFPSPLWTWFSNTIRDFDIIPASFFKEVNQHQEAAACPPSQEEAIRGLPCSGSVLSSS